MFVVVLGLKSRSDADAVAAVRAWFECVLIACELEMLTRQCLAESELLWLCVLGFRTAEMPCRAFCCMFYSLLHPRKQHWKTY